MNDNKIFDGALIDAIVTSKMKHIFDPVSGNTTETLVDSSDEMYAALLTLRYGVIKISDSLYCALNINDDKDFKGISDEPSESENAFAKNDYKKRNRNETDDDNYEIYSHARKVCTRYIKGQIDKIFVGVLPEDHEEDFVAKDVSKSHLGDNPSQPIDPSNDAVKI